MMHLSISVMVTVEVKSPIVDIPIATTPPTQLQTTVTTRTPELPSTDAAAAVISIPSYSRWFSMDTIHQSELRVLPEFFDLQPPSKKSSLYVYCRNSIVNKFRANPSRKLTFTEARKTLVGDVGSVRRVFDFLEAWGLINYMGTESKMPLKWDDKDDKAAGGDHPSGKSLESSGPSKRWCSGCKSLCSIACFVCDKDDLTLCSRCYVRGNYRVGVISSDFRRVEINDEVKSEWTDKETLQLLEAVVHHGDDWKRVAENVAGRSEKECVSRFLKFPCGEEFRRYADMNEECEGGDLSSLSKRICLTPFNDASNPIMGQAAFLSALAGVEVSRASARAAVRAIYDVNHITSDATRQDAESQLQKEEQDVETAISSVIDVQMNDIQEKINHFEELELQMEKEREHLQQMKHFLFGDQLSLFFRTNAATRKEQGKDKLNSSAAH